MGRRDAASGIVSVGGMGSGPAGRRSAPGTGTRQPTRGPVRVDEDDRGKRRAGDRNLPAAGRLMKIPFTKAHGAMNDFLLTWRRDAPDGDHAAIAKAICERHTGIGADGWMLVSTPEGSDADGSIEL